MYISKKDPDAVIVTESADRLARPVEQYLDTLLAAARVAYEKKVLLAMGVKPRYANPGYGHIKRGKFWGNVNKVKFYKLDKFVEKPPLELAEKYTASSNYFWNAGQFVWRADLILSSLQKHESDIYRKLKNIEPFLGTKEERQVLKHEYRQMPKISIDYAVAEKDKNFLMVEADFFWTDIGDWKEVWENLPKDKENNVIISGQEPGGEVINIDTSGAFIHTDGRLVAVVDVDDIIVVDTKEALLVCSKSRAQSVKKIVERLKEEGRRSLL